MAKTPRPFAVLVVAILFQAASYGTVVYSFTLFVTFWVDEFGVSRAQAMAATLAATIGGGLLAPVGGKLLDHFSARAMICLGSVFVATGLAIVGGATAFWQIFVVYTVVLAPGLVLTGPLAAQALAVRWAQGKLGSALGWVSIGTSLGGFAIPVIVGFCLEKADWRTVHFVLAAGVFLAIAPSVWLVVRGSPPTRPGTPPQASAPVGAVGGPEPIIGFREILVSPGFWTPAVIFTPLMTSFMSVQFNLGPYAADVGLDLHRAAVLVGLLSIATVAGKIVFGLLVDRWDPRVVIALAASSGAVSVILLANAPDFRVLVGIAIVLGLAAGSFAPVSGKLLTTRFGPDMFGRAMGSLYAIMMLAGFGAPATAWIRDELGSYDAAFCVLASLTGLGALAVLSLSPERRQG